MGYGGWSRCSGNLETPVSLPSATVGNQAQWLVEEPYRGHGKNRDASGSPLAVRNAARGRSAAALVGILALQHPSPTPWRSISLDRVRCCFFFFFRCALLLLPIVSSVRSRFKQTAAINTAWDREKHTDNANGRAKRARPALVSQAHSPPHLSRTFSSATGCFAPAGVGTASLSQMKQF